MHVIPPPLKKILDKWNIRGLVILSLLLQTSLIFLAPLRKRTSKKLLAAVLWTSYLLADWTANYAVAQITKNQGKDPKPGDPPLNKKVLALWAPFLLLHLGGPDTITALALEDNALWKRHLFGLVSQVIAGVYAVVQSMENVLWLSITLLLITGVIKYAEKTRALYAVAIENFKDVLTLPPNPGHNYYKLMEVYGSRQESNIPTDFILFDEPDKHERPWNLVRPLGQEHFTHLEIVQYGYKFFRTIFGLVLDLDFGLRDREEIKNFFRDQLQPEEALQIIDSELDFVYESMYTKTAILHTRTGILFRVIAFGSLISSFFFFHRRPLKSVDFHGADVAITYTLFIVGIALDLASMGMFLLSDWTLVTLSKFKDDPEKERQIASLLNWFLALRKPRWKTLKRRGRRIHEVLATPFLKRRWPCTIYGLSFMRFCLKAKVSRTHQNRILTVWESVFLMFDCVIRKKKMLAGWVKNVSEELSQKNLMIRCTIYPLYLVVFSGIPTIFGLVWGCIDGIFSVKANLDEIRFVTKEHLTKSLWEVIFSELRHRSQFEQTAEADKKLSSGRGEWGLRNLTSDTGRLMRYLENMNYDQSLLIWHIATELCFHEEEEDPSGKSCDDREFSKIMSDYMMYLLIMRPKFMSKVAGIGTIRFRDTLAEAERFFRERHVKNPRDMKEASKTVLSVSCDIEPIIVKGNLRSKSVFFDATKLAKELQRLDDSRNNGYGKWRTLTNVWIELLSHAARHCGATEHVVQLSRGGELLNFVWLLMVHFGLAGQFQTNKYANRVKLVAAS